MRKIRIDLDTGSGIKSETVWAHEVTEGVYRLMNVPFYAVGFAEGDIVRCVTRDGLPTVTELVRDSGNGTIRIMFFDSKNQEAEELLYELTSIGCTYERASSRLVAVTVPQTLDVTFLQLADYLNSTPDTVVQGWEIAKNMMGKSPDAVSE